MKDIDYLQLLSKNFKNQEETCIEIANLNAILSLPKGTEYFFSDLHGEHESFIHLLRSASGIIRKKIKIIFEKELSDVEILDLANIIYYPKEKLEHYDFKNENTFAFQKDIILRLLIIVKSMSEKYTRSKIRKTISSQYIYIIEELLYKDIDINNNKKTKYYDEIIKTIVDIGLSKKFIIELCILIQKLAVDSLHIVGDIFDRGARHDLILDELIDFHTVDIEWGNHDIEWIGAFMGNEVLICNALRIAVRYNCYDMLEDGYGINLRKLSEFADSVYLNDPCELFKPNIIDENIYDVVSPIISAKMQKALTVMQFKLEGQLFKKHPEYELSDRIMLERIDYKKGTINIEGKEYKLLDTNFPTIDVNNPIELSKEEKELMISLKNSFMRSRKLKEHIKFLLDKGNMYKVYNGNLMYHGVIPFDEDGNLAKIKLFKSDKYLSGKAYLDWCSKVVNDAYVDSNNKKYSSDNIDFMYYLWCGKYSPLFGKDRIRTFELYFVDDEEIRKENPNPYYKFIVNEDSAKLVLRDFGLKENGHIINGHVPVKKKDGESPVKANGRVFVIDGGLSKGYQKKTGIAGYTLVYDSINLFIATHKPYEKGKFNTPVTEEIEKVAIEDRVYVKDTDIGQEIKKQIADLKDLLTAYRTGLINEK